MDTEPLITDHAAVEDSVQVAHLLWQPLSHGVLAGLQQCSSHGALVTLSITPPASPCLQLV